MSVVEAHELKLVARAQAVIVSVKVGILGVSARVRACERERATCAVESESTSMRRARRLRCAMGRARVGFSATARSTSAAVSTRRSCGEMGRWGGESGGRRGDSHRHRAGNVLKWCAGAAGSLRLRSGRGLQTRGEDRNNQQDFVDYVEKMEILLMRKRTIMKKCCKLAYGD